MKKILTLGALLTMLISCNKNEEKLDNFKGKELSAEAFFKEVVKTNIELGEDEVILFSFGYNSENQTVIMDSHKVAEMSFAVAFDLAASEKENLTKKDDGKKVIYKVKCENGKNSWEKTCDGKYSCGSSVIDCIDKGGCATLCKVNMVYVPSHKTFYIADDIKFLVENN